MRAAGLVLAAGGGTRFGGPKVVAPLDGERLVDRAVRTLRAGGCDPILVVLGALEVDVPGALTYVNDDWRTGIASSLIVGLDAAADINAEVVVVILVDEPGMTPTAVSRTLAACLGGTDLAVATYGGVRGHPVVLGRDHWRGVRSSARGDSGARAYLNAHAESVAEVPCGDIADPFDIDTQSDLDHFGVE